MICIGLIPIKILYPNYYRVSSQSCIPVTSPYLTPKNYIFISIPFYNFVIIFLKKKKMESCNEDLLNDHTYANIGQIAVDKHLNDHNYNIPSKRITLFISKC